MEATLDAKPPANEPDLSPGVRYGLLAAAIAAALLGLVVLDVEGTPRAKRRLAEDQRTTECIVASALFVGIVTQTHAP